MGGMSSYWSKADLIQLRDALTEVIEVISEEEKYAKEWMDKIMMSSVQRGMFSIYTHESKFTENINTKVNAEKPVLKVIFWGISCMDIEY